MLSSPNNDTFSEREAKGNRLIYKIVTEYLLEGYFVQANYGHSEGVDVTVIYRKDGKVHAVCECKNYQKFTKYGKAEYVHSETFHKEVDKLNEFDKLPDVEKWYIVSYAEILSYEQKETLNQHNIRLRIIGYEP